MKIEVFSWSVGKKKENILEPIYQPCFLSHNWLGQVINVWEKFLVVAVQEL